MDVRTTDLMGLKLSHQVEAPVGSSRVGSKTADSSRSAEQSVSFAESLQQEYNKSSGVHFSKHATQRMQMRGVEMTPGLLDSLNQAIDKARTKGAKDVAVISDKSVFIVNVPNNTVITTMNGLEMKENIFTNIDSAVLI